MGFRKFQLIFGGLPPAERGGGAAGEGRQPLFRFALTRTFRVASVLEHVRHGNVGVDFDGLAVEISWLVAPLLHSFRSRHDE